MTFKKRHATKDQERRDCRLGARFTKTEQQKIARVAAQAKMSQSDLVMFLVDDYEKRVDHIADASIMVATSASAGMAMIFNVRIGVLTEQLCRE